MLELRHWAGVGAQDFAAGGGCSWWHVVVGYARPLRIGSISTRTRVQENPFKMA